MKLTELRQLIELHERYWEEYARISDLNTCKKCTEVLDDIYNTFFDEQNKEEQKKCQSEIN